MTPENRSEKLSHITHRQPHEIVEMGLIPCAEVVLLLDEPSMGLVPFLVKEIMRIILRLNKEGVTILLVEQNARVALQLAEHGYVLETGEIVIQGNAETLRRDESIVKAYLGE